MTETEMLRAQVETLTKALAAATNDAARAELRARDAVELWSRFDALSASNAGNSDNRFEMAFVELEEEIRAALAASPDSDARLREVLEEACQRTARESHESCSVQCGESPLGHVTEKEHHVDIKRIIDEVLGAKSKG